MKRSFKIILAIIAFCFTSLFTNGQDGSAPKNVKVKKPLKNTIRMNITNPFIFGGEALIFGYERVLGPRQTFSVNVGQMSLPKLSLSRLHIDDPDIQVRKDYSDKGLNLSLDYRFYLNKLNAFDAPRGVYVAPFLSYNYFERKNHWDITTDNFKGELNTNLRMDFLTGGVTLGYQFIFWRRFAVDFILLGPGIANYNIKLKLDASLVEGDESEIIDKINEYIQEYLPGQSIIFDDAEFRSTGISKTTTVGFRYMINLGLRF